MFLSSSIICNINTWSYAAQATQKNLIIRAMTSNIVKTKNCQVTRYSLALSQSQCKTLEKWWILYIPILVYSNKTSLATPVSAVSFAIYQQTIISFSYTPVNYSELSITSELNDMLCC